MPLQIRENRIDGEAPRTLSDAEKALRRLRTAVFVEELSVGVHGSVSHFRFNTDSEDARSIEYQCAACGLHLRLNWVEAAGDVICRDGRVEGVTL